MKIYVYCLPYGTAGEVNIKAVVCTPPPAQCLVQPSLVYTLLCPPPEPVTRTTSGACQAASHRLYSGYTAVCYSSAFTAFDNGQGVISRTSLNSTHKTPKQTHGVGAPIMHYIYSLSHSHTQHAKHYISFQQDCNKTESGGLSV